MKPFDEIQNYTRTVCQQIRWRTAQPMVAAEIEDHLCDQRDAYMASGDDEAAATDRAILQMGDAVAVGQALDQTHRPRPQWAMLALTGALMLIGVLANTYFAGLSTGYASYSFHAQVWAVIPAMGILIGCYFLDFSALGKHPLLGYAGVVAVSLLSLFQVRMVNGRHYWAVGDLSLAVNTSYLALVFPLCFALLVYGLRGRGYQGILLCGVGYLPMAAALLCVPTVTGFMLYTLAALAVLCFAICRGVFGVSRKRGLLLVLGPTLGALAWAVLLVVQNPRLLQRFGTVLNPYTDPYGAGYVHVLLRELLADAAFVGQGASPLPGEVLHFASDFGLTFLTHRFGWVALVGIAAIFLLFSAVSLNKAAGERSLLGSLVALSIALTFLLQVLTYLAESLGYGFFSSLSLPFVSAGRTALFVNAALVGFMLSVFRTGHVHRDRVVFHQNRPFLFSYADGKLVIDLRGDRG